MLSRRLALKVSAGGVLISLANEALGPNAVSGAQAIPELNLKSGSGINLTTAVHVVAHADDGLLFLNPDGRRDFERGLKTLIICLTAGQASSDPRADPSYWQEREVGLMASVAALAQAPNVWQLASLTVNGTRISAASLVPRPEISVAFFRLPDGNVNGSGFPATSRQSLQTLWNDPKGTTATISAVDDSATYTKQSLIATLASIFSQLQPRWIRTQDFLNNFGSGDHSDHYGAGRFTQAANALYSGRQRFLIGYLGYPASWKPANLTGRDLGTKQASWLAYAAHDPVVPQTLAACAIGDGQMYGSWLVRQYQVANIKSG
jgi:LmbE family N-acetylglucosaminyl deacetylase